MPQAERCNAGDGRQGSQQAIERIGFPDVVDDLFRVDQIIDGDEVEANAEFVPENPFRRGDKQHEKQADADQTMQGQPVPALLPKPPGTKQEIDSR